MSVSKKVLLAFGSVAWGLAPSGPLWASGADNLGVISFSLHNLWILLAAALVFIMHLGFATLEAGVVQKKNRINILFKNTCIISMGLLVYSMVGFSLMYPGEDFAGGFFGFAGVGLSPGATGMTPEYNPSYTYWTDFIFQAMFAATAATIVSGAVAERIKIIPFMVFSFIFLAIVYPVVGMWKWGGGFLDAMATPFYDFAGSSLVHSVGGWAALAGAMILGPRLGKYMPHKDVDLKPGSVGLATIGVFLLWFGWYGFNGGSVLSADPAALSLVFVTTSLAAAAGIFAAALTNFVVDKTLDPMMALNGALAGLVSITAGADLMGPMEAIVIGLIGGALVVASIKMLDKLKIDDPVSAISVHLTCGIWGTLAVGVFGSQAGMAQLASQAVGIFAIGLFCFVSSFLLFKIIDVLVELRVSEKIEVEGLDIHEHSVDNTDTKHQAFGLEVSVATGGK